MRKLVFENAEKKELSHCLFVINFMYSLDSFLPHVVENAGSIFKCPYVKVLLLIYSAIKEADLAAH